MNHTMYVVYRVRANGTRVRRVSYKSLDDARIESRNARRRLTRPEDKIIIVKHEILETLIESGE